MQYCNRIAVRLIVVLVAGMAHLQINTDPLAHGLFDDKCEIEKRKRVGMVCAGPDETARPFLTLI